MSSITLKTSTIKDFSSAFNEFRGKYPKNIDLSSAYNFNYLFYNTDLDTIPMDSFVDSTYTATRAPSVELNLSSMFTSFTGRDISFDLWGFLVKKVKLLELIKSYYSISMYSMMAYVRSVPFFSLYEIYMALADETFYRLQSRLGYSLNINNMATAATFKELEMPILNMDGNLFRRFSLSTFGTNGVGKLIFRQPPTQNIASIDTLKTSIAGSVYYDNFMSSNKPAENTYKLPTTIVVRLLRAKTSIPETADSIEAIKTFLNATYSTPKENISVIFE